MWVCGGDWEDAAEAEEGELMKHTEGPWQVYEISDQRAKFREHSTMQTQRYFSVLDADGYDLAEFYGPNQAADAALVAAAPEMLETLEATVQQLREYEVTLDEEFGIRTDDVRTTSAAEEQAVAVIAKARGEDD